MMKQSSIKASFEHTDLESGITEYALGLMAERDNNVYASGTAIIIANRLAMTAKHVIEDFYKKFEGFPLGEGDHKGNFHLQAFHIQNGQVGAIWNATRIYGHHMTDIVMLRLDPVSESAKSYKWNFVEMDLYPPSLGTRIVGFGYRSPEITQRQGVKSWRVGPCTSVGEVIEVHDCFRDSCRLNFPCFRTNARFDGGMSGGPVFNNDGRLCGLICSNLPPESNDSSGEHVSYITSLWPSMVINLDINRKGYPQGVNYPALELAKSGFIKAKDWERVSFIKNEDGENVKIVFCKR